MTQDEIIDMAKQAGIEEAYSLKHNQYLVKFKDGSLEVFAKLIEEAEREKCAKVARLFHDPNYGFFLTKNSTESSRNHVALEIEAAIRARGQA
jgi:hypothetical protein